MKQIQGSGIGGGGGGGGGQSIQSPTGISTDYVDALLAIGAGQIEGIIDGSKGVFFDNTPLQNEDNSLNFADISVSSTNGLLDQQNFSNSNGQIVNTTSVNVDVTKVIPVTRTVINAEATHIRVRLAFQLQQQTDNGDIKSNTITFRILLQQGAGAFIEVVNQTINERYPDFTINQPNGYLFPIDTTQDTFTVRVEKLSNDSTDTNISNLKFLSISAITQTQIEYKNVAILRLLFPSKIFQSNPSIGLKLGGWLCPIPVNSTIAASELDRGLTFSGGWNGEFYLPALATTDPAWIVYRLLTDELNGMGIAPQYIDKYSLYQCSVYNNGLVSNAYGGLERRFSFSAILTQQQNALDTIRSICASFAAKPYWNGSQISFWQDRPDTTLPKILGNADVENGDFNYVSGEYQSTTTQAKVWWQDPNDKYNSVPEVVEVQSVLNEYGVQSEEFTQLGETRRGGAIRAGRRIIFNSIPALGGEIFNEQVSCRVRPHAIFFNPGDIIQIADSGRGRQRKAGLIKSATTSAITLDAPTSISGNPGKQILVLMPDLTVETRGITNSAGTHTVINLDSPLPVAPLSHASWQIVDGAIDIKKYRIISVIPAEDNPNIYEVIGKLYRDDRYSLIENGIAGNVDSGIDRPPVIMPPPLSLKAVLREVTFSGSVNYTLDSFWSAPLRNDGQKETYLSYYVAEFKNGADGVWTGSQQIINPSARWENVGGGLFFVRVAAVSTNGKTSSWVEINTSATAFNSQYVADASNSNYTSFIGEM